MFQETTCVICNGKVSTTESDGGNGRAVSAWRVIPEEINGEKLYYSPAVVCFLIMVRTVPTRSQ